MVKSFLKYYKPYMTILIGVIIGTFVMAGLDLIFPIVVRYLINEILPSKNMHQLFIGSGVLLFLYIVNFIVQYAVQYYGHIMSASIEQLFATGLDWEGAINGTSQKTCLND